MKRINIFKKRLYWSILEALKIKDKVIHILNTYLELGPPEGDVVQPFAEPAVRIALSEDRLLFPLSHQPHGLVLEEARSACW